MRDAAVMEALELKLMRETPPDHARNLRIFEAMYEEACALGVFPLKNPAEGLEVDMEVARVLNGYAAKTS